MKATAIQKRIIADQIKHIMATAGEALTRFNDGDFDKAVTLLECIQLDARGEKERMVEYGAIILEDL